MWVGRRTGCRTGCGEVRQDAGEAGVWGSHLALPTAGSCLHGGHSPVPLLPSSQKKKKVLFNLTFLESISRQAQVKMSLC